MRILLFGAMLLLLPQRTVSSPEERALVLIRTPRSGVVAGLLADNIMVVRETDRFIIAAATHEERERLDRHGLAWDVLDETTAGKTYYTLSVRNGEALDQFASRVRILELDPPYAVIEADPHEAEALTGAGIEIARVFMRPMRMRAPVRPERAAAVQEYDAEIQQIVDSVSGAGVDGHVQTLQDFGSRYSRHDSCLAAAQYIKGQFQSYGIDSVFFHDFSPTYHDNVVAVKPGVTKPQKIVVIGAHYDSRTPDADDAPGADDNASGTACVLECARVLSPHDFDYTLKFIAFCAEEQGLLGSEAYAGEAAARGDDIVAMVNVDMIGYLAAGDILDLDIIDDPGSQWIRDRVMGVGALYVPGFALVDGAIPGGASSDHRSFWENGYDAIMFFEDTNNYSPYIHTVADTIGLSYNAPALALGSVRVAAGLVADLARPFRVAITHTPLGNTEDTTNTYPVVATIRFAGTPNPDSLFVDYSTGLGPGRVPLLPTGVPDEYQALIPPQPAGAVVDYYLVAEDMDGHRTVHPDGAPASFHRFVVGSPSVVFAADFESDTGWVVGDVDDDATSGTWERVDPNGTEFAGQFIVQPEDDHTPDPGIMCYVTGNAPPGEVQGWADVDSGKTTLLSPAFDLSAYTSAWVRYYRWYTNDTGGNVDDEWVVDVSADGGANWTRLESDSLSDRSWRLVERNLPDFIPLTSEVKFRFIASDNDPSSVVEAGVDDFTIVTYQAIGSGVADVPGAGKIALEQNFPNPFNPKTSIRFHVTGPPRRVTLRIFDVSGRLVATLLENSPAMGTRTVTWNARNDGGRDVASGVYFYRLEAGAQSATRKLVLIR